MTLCLSANVSIPSQFYLNLKLLVPQRYISFFLQSTQQEILIPPILKAPKVVECLNSTVSSFWQTCQLLWENTFGFIISSSLLLSLRWGFLIPTFMHWWFQLCYLKFFSGFPIYCEQNPNLNFGMTRPRSTFAILFCNSQWSSISHTGCLPEPQIYPFFFLTSE